MTAGLNTKKNTDSFGSTMPGRNYQSSSSYRYGFNGKENDLESGTQDYGMRIYNPALSKFLSVDPISVKYPELTPYQFASNRPIDGIDLDGLEYATFTVYLKLDGTVTGFGPVMKDYELKDKASKGPGIQINYVTEDGQKWSSFTKNMYGIYQGGDNPKLPKIGGDFRDKFDDYSLEPIDETDKTAKQHDLDYDNAGKLAGLNGILSSGSSDANLKYIKTANKIIDKFKKGETDDVTKKPVTKETAEAAEFGRKWFSVAEDYKEAVGGTPTIAKPDNGAVQKPDKTYIYKKKAPVIRR